MTYFKLPPQQSSAFFSFKNRVQTKIYIIFGDIVRIEGDTNLLIAVSSMPIIN